MSHLRLEQVPAVVELRQYLLHRGRRDELIELFDREFVDTQEALGIRVIGQFRDIDRANHFVWLRAFSDQASRRESLESFYSGPAWRKHGRAAAATMSDSGDVHQLRGIAIDRELRIRRACFRDSAGDRGSIVIIVSHRRDEHDDEHDELIRRYLIPEVEQAGFRTIGLYTTDPTENVYPALPIRASNVLVWIGAAESADALDTAAHHVAIARERLAEQAETSNRAEFLLDVLRLEPTDQSCLNGTDVEADAAASGRP
jgi:hypothetical protein